MSGVANRHAWSLPWFLLYSVDLRIILPLQPAAVSLQLGPDFLIHGFSLGVIPLLQPAAVPLQLGPYLGGPEHGRFVPIWNTHVCILGGEAAPGSSSLTRSPAGLPKRASDSTQGEDRG